MKRGMLYFCLLIVMTFVLGFYTAKCVHADYWRQNASLVPGTYMVVYKSLDQTAELAAVYEYLDNMGFDRVTNFQWTGFSAVFDIDGDRWTTDKFVAFLNTEPKTTPENEPMLFRLIDDVWVVVSPLPNRS